MSGNQATSAQAGTQQSFGQMPQQVANGFQNAQQGFQNAQQQFQTHQQQFQQRHQQFQDQLRQWQDQMRQWQQNFPGRPGFANSPGFTPPGAPPAAPTPPTPTPYDVNGVYINRTGGLNPGPAPAAPPFPTFPFPGFPGAPAQPQAQGNADPNAIIRQVFGSMGNVPVVGPYFSNIGR